MSKYTELNDAKISFCLAQSRDEDLIKSWLDKPHIKNYWDNSSDLLENLQNYLQGTKDIFDYWLGFYDIQPYALIMTSDANDSTPEHLLPWVKPKEITWTIVNSGEVGDVVTSRRLPTITKVILYFTLFGCKK